MCLFNLLLIFQKMKIYSLIKNYLKISLIILYSLNYWISKENLNV